MLVKVTIEIADEDWEDPAFQDVWGEMVDEGVLRVVSVEEERKEEGNMLVKALLGDKAQASVEYLLPTVSLIVIAAIVFAFKML